MNGTGLDFRETEGVELSRSVCRLKAVNDFVATVCTSLHHLLWAYCAEDETAYRQELHRYADRTTLNRFGRVCASDIGNVLEDGNIREQMTLLNQFCMYGGDVIWWGVFNQWSGFRSSKVESTIARLERLFGCDVEVLEEMAHYKLGHVVDLATASKHELNLASLILGVYAEGPVSMAKTMSAMFPHEPAARRSLEPAIWRTHATRLRDMVPPLGRYETAYLQQNHPQALHDGYVQFHDGRTVIEVIPDNVFGRIADVVREPHVAGPSGSASMHNELFSFFTDFDPTIACLANVAALCSAPHHSIFEVLLGCTPYGIEFKASLGGPTAIEFVQFLIDSVRDAAGDTDEDAAGDEYAFEPDDGVINEGGGRRTSPLAMVCLGAFTSVVACLPR
jgi:hypothetical protein